MTTLRDLVGQVIQKKKEEKRIAEEQAAKDQYWKIPICYDDDEDDTIAITPILPIEELDNSLRCSQKCDVPLCENTTPLNALNEHSGIVVNSNDDNSSSDDDSTYGKDIDYVDASPPDVEIVSLEVVEIVDAGKKIGSGSPTTHFDYHLRILKLTSFKTIFKERSSGNTTTHVDFSQYDSFIFDLSNDQFPPTDRSDLNHEEFADELAHIISPPEYDHFCFKIEPELGNLTMDVVNDIFPTREPRVHVPNVLPTHPTLDTDFILLSEPLFAYIVWIFLPFLTYPVAPPYLLSTRNEDTIFDPGISIYHSFMPDVSHRSGTFIKFNDFPDCEDSRACSIHMSFTSSASFWESRTDNYEKDEKQSQNDKTGLGMEKTVKDKAKSKPKSQSSQKVNRKVNWSKSKSTPTNPKVNM
ncbi:hypothetical protein Tco_0793500 [Tanacetum coccineum]